MYDSEYNPTPRKLHALFTKRRGLLSRDTDRVFAPLLHCGVIDNQHRIIAANEPFGPS